MMHGGAERFTFARCDACGLVFLDPRVSVDALARYYTESYLPYRGPDAWGRWRGFVAAGLRATDQKRVARVRQHVRLGASTRILDVGCGRPTFLEALGREAACTRVGTDFSDKGWAGDLARWSDLELHRGELAELIEPPASARATPSDPPPPTAAPLSGPFDVVTMWHYLEHDDAPGATLARVRALSSPETRLIIEVPDLGSWSQRRYREHWAGYHTPRHTAIWDRDTMRLLLERSGWAVESIEPVGTLDPWVLVWMSRQERAGIDWSASMESRFAGFMLGRLFAWPLLALQARARGRGGNGFLTAVARPA
jgi:hypothetical protein